MVMASLGEETRASCRGPSNHNAIALILPHKALLGFNGGAIGADVHCDRTGIHARALVDCAKILDALKDADNGYYDARDPFTTVPRSSVLTGTLCRPRDDAGPCRRAGRMRIGVIRESMIYPKGSKTEQPIVVAAAIEIKEMLGHKLGATLVESSHALWERDPELEVMTVDYTRALAQLIPLIMPDILFRLDGKGQPLFPDFADAIVPTEFLPGKIFGNETMQPIDYCVAMAEGLIPPPSNLDIRTIQQQELSNTFRYHLSQYLMRRADDWQHKGFRETLSDWKALNARSKFWGDDQRAAFKNWEEVADPRNRLDRPAGCQ